MIDPGHHPMDNNGDDGEAATMVVVVAAIEALCNPTSDPASRSQVTGWLEHFQNTLGAWKTSMDLLLSSTISNQAVLIFAAQTLKHKLIHDYAQLDEPTTVGLREHLWSMIGGVSSESPLLQYRRPVLAQLQLALAALAVQANEALWLDPVGDALQTLRSSTLDSQRQHSLIDFLAMIPEQLANTQIHLPTDFYRSQRDRLLRGDRLNELLCLLAGHLAPGSTDTNTTTSTSIWSCLLSWVRYGSTNALVDSTGLLRAAFAHVQSSLGNGDEEGLDTASELICELYYREHQSDRPQPSSAWMQAMLDGLYGTFGLFPLLKIGEDGDQGEQVDLVRRIAPLYVEAGEAFMSSLVMAEASHPGALEMIASAVLALSQSSDRGIVEDTLVFWAALASQQSLNHHGDEGSSFLEPLFRQVFMALLARHLVQPASSTISAEEMDAFRDFRHIVGDALKDCCRVLGSTETVHMIGQIIIGGDDSDPHRKIEAALFALRTVSSVVDRRESEALPRLYPALLKIVHHPKLVYGVVLVIGCYADWLRYHGEWIQASLEYVLAALGHEETRSAAALSLKHLAESVGGMMGGGAGGGAGRFQAILTEQVYPQALVMLGSGQISGRVLGDISEAIARVLALDRTFPAALETILAPWRDVLATPGGGGPEQVSLALDQYGSIVEAVMMEARDAIDHGHPPLPAAQYLADHFGGQVWPLLEGLLLLNPMVPIIVGPLGAFLEAGLSVPEDRLLPLIDRCLVECPRAMGVLRAYLLSVVVPTSAPPSTRLLQSLGRAISVTASHPETHASDLVVLMTSAVDYLASVASNPDLVVATLGITQTVLGTATASTPDLFQSLLFILHLLAVKDDSSSASSLVEIDRAIWANIETILAGLVQFYPPTVIGDVASILRRYRRGTDDLGRLFGQVLAALPSGYFVDRERQVLQEQFNQALSAPRARDMKDFLLQFSQTCRRRLK